MWFQISTQLYSYAYIQFISTIEKQSSFYDIVQIVPFIYLKFLIWKSFILKM